MKKILVLACFAFAGSAWASGIEFWVLGGQTLINNAGLGTEECAPGAPTSLCQSIGATSNDIALTDGFHFGFRGGFNFGDHIGYEVGYMYNRTNLKFNDQGGFEEGMAYHQVAFNALWHFLDQDSKFRPFVTAGVGFTNYAPPGTSAAYGGGDTKLGFNYGGGVKYRLTSLFGLRLDVRQAITPKPLGLPLASGWLRENEFSAGFGVYF